MKPLLKSFLKPSLLSVVGSGAILGPITLTQTNKTSEFNLPKLTLRERPQIIEKELTPALGSEGGQEPEQQGNGHPPPATPPKQNEQNDGKNPPKSEDSEGGGGSPSGGENSASGSTSSLETCDNPEVFESIIFQFLEYKMGENEVTHSNSVKALIDCSEIPQNPQTPKPDNSSPEST